jgi:hypothetical protein
MDELRLVEVFELQVSNADTGEEITLVEPAENGEEIALTWNEQGVLRFEG